MSTDKTLAGERNCQNGRAEHMPTCASLRTTLADKVRYEWFSASEQWKACDQGEARKLSSAGYQVREIRSYGVGCTCPSGDGSLRHPCPSHPSLADVQPGGRVRLGDSLTTRRFIAERTTNPEHRQDVLDGDYDGTEWFAHVQAALSVQPSPGGQGDARAQFEAWAESAGWYAVAYRPDRDAPYALNAVEFAWQAFQAALAARQPVEFERAIPTRRRESAVELLLQLGFVWNNQQWEDRRQPVGEPVAYLDLGAGGYMDVGTDLSDEELAVLPKGRHMLGIIGTYGVDGYKPAQAVDLGQLPDGWRLSKKATCYQLSHGNDIIGNLVGPDAEENAAIIARVLDSQAVGK